MTRARARYEPSPSTPRHARQFVTQALAAWSCESVHEDAEVLTTEVVTDALLHKPSQVSVLVEHIDGVLRIEVSDDPGLIMSPPPPGRFERKAARRLVRTLARRWGSDADRGRTTTWFELDAPLD